MVEEKEEDIVETISGLFAEYLGEQSEDVTSNLDSVYKLKMCDSESAPKERSGSVHCKKDKGRDYH